MSQPLFDVHVVVDWSSAATRKIGKDSIWIAVHGETEHCVNPDTRASAIAFLAQTLDAANAEGLRVLIGFDFAFGYPKGLAKAIGPKADWRDVWALIAKEVGDEDDNANNRFDAAAKLNALFDSDGPFWANALKRDIEGLPRTKPKGWGTELPANRRAADELVPNAQEVWKLAGIGSVGGQSLVGIARLEKLRQSRRDLLIWPFETFGVAGRHVAAEVFPSLIRIQKIGGEPHDKTQVLSLARALRHLDKEGVLTTLLEAPSNDAGAKSFEASILGLAHKELLQSAVDAILETPQSAPLEEV